MIGCFRLLFEQNRFEIVEVSHLKHLILSLYFQNCNQLYIVNEL